MRDALFLTKLRVFLGQWRWRAHRRASWVKARLRHLRRRARRLAGAPRQVFSQASVLRTQSSPSVYASRFVLEPLENRILLAADLTGVIQSAAALDPAVPTNTASAVVQVQNLGNQNVTQSQIGVYASLDTVLDSSDLLLGTANTGSVLVGASKNVTVNLTLPNTLQPVTYNLLAKVDNANALAENSETNNVAIGGTVNGTWQFGAVPGRAGNTTLTLREADGTTVTFRLSGPGTGEVIHDGSNWDLKLTGTTASSAVTITTNSGGNGRVTLNDVHVFGPLAAFTAATADLSGTMAIDGPVNISGILPGAITLRSVQGGTLAVPSVEALTILGSTTNATFLIGATLGQDGQPGGTGANTDTYGQGKIGLFTVTGAMTNTAVRVGIDPVDGTYGNGNDQLIGGTNSNIGGLIIGGTLSADTRFYAGRFPTQYLNGLTLKPTAGDFHFISNFSGPSLTAALQQDTGNSTSDRLTNNPAITGTVTDPQGIATFTAGFGATPTVNILSDRQADGSFTLTRARLDQINGAALIDGTYVLKLQATDTVGNSTQISVPFTLDTVVPTLTLDLDPASDSAPVGDQQTTNAIVTLIGQTEADAAVELLGLGLTTTAGASGQFSFTNVALTLGANNFTVRATDSAGNQRTEARTITRLAVNQAPVLDPIGNQTVNEEVLLTFTAQATDLDAGQTLTFSLENGTSGHVPAGASIDPTTGVFTWTPTEAQGPGTFAFDVVVTDNGSPSTLSDRETITVTVNEVNQAPKLILPSVGLVIDNVSVLEGDSGTTNAVFTVTLTAPSPVPVSVNFQTFTLSGTPPPAIEGSDFQSVSGTLVFAPGEQSKTITVSVLGDTTVEQDERFFVSLTEAVNAGIIGGVGQASIIDNDTSSGPEFVINDVTIVEGDSGTTNAVFTVSLTSSPPAGARVEFAVTSGGGGFQAATPGADFSMVPPPPPPFPLPPLTLLFDPGETTKTITVAITGDTTIEPIYESFSVTLSNPVGATIRDGVGIGHIVDNEPRQGQGIVINDVTVVEGDSGTTNAVFTVGLTAPSLVPVTVNFSTVDGIPGFPAAAVAPGDYVATSGALTFAPGVQVQTITIPIVGDTTLEQNEGFSVMLSDAVNASISDGVGFGHIFDTEFSPEPQFLINDVTVVEGSTEAILTVTLSSPAPGGARVDYTGTSPTFETLFFAPNETTKTITVPVGDDNLPQPNGTIMTIHLQGALGATIADADGVIRILDNGDSPDFVDAQNAQVGTPLTFTASAVDADIPSNTLVFSLEGTVPPGASIDPVTGVFTWTPTTAGTYPIKIRVTDNGTPNLFDEGIVTITVTGEPNVAPVLSSIGNQTVDEGQLLTFTATATDADAGQTLTFALANGVSGQVPAGASIDPTTGVFTWTPTEAQGPGTYTFDVVVTDNGSPTTLSDRETITVTVNEVNQAPTLEVIPNQTVTAGQPLTFTAVGHDSDVPANQLTYSLQGTVPAGAAIDPTTGVFTWTPTNAQVGPQSVTVRVTDNGTPNLFAEQTVAITVVAANQAPTAVNDSYTIVQDTTLVSGTLLVKDIVPGAGSSQPFLLVNVNGTVFFAPDDGVNGRELWKSDGTAAGTVLVKDITPGIASSGFVQMVDVNGMLFFGVDAPGTGIELWKSDGTSVGTVLVKDIFPGLNGSIPQSLTNVNGTLFFTANDDVNGIELWKSDGTEAGTVLIKNVRAGGPGSNPSRLTNVNGTLFFTADDGVNGVELWKSDGTEAGTVLVKDIRLGDTSNPIALTNLNGTLFFAANDGVHGLELWKSDGTEAGTVLVKDIIPGSVGAFSSSLTNVNGTLFFTANDGVNGTELWKSDGTAAGTVLVKDIRLGSLSSSAFSFTNVGGTLFFVANDGVNGPELWKSDGTAAGTVLVKNILPGINPSFAPSNLTNVNGTLFFTVDDGVSGPDLWKSDGTAAGTVLVKDITVAAGDSPLVFLTDVNGTLFFSANDGATGKELWKYVEASVLANDTDPENDSLTAILVNGPSNGTLTLNADGTFSYMPNAGFVGTDSFTYKANDGSLDSNVATVTITVTAAPVLNHAPVLDPIGTQTVNEGALLTFTATATDPDAGQALTFSLANGTSGQVPAGASINPSTGVFTWTPTAGQVGQHTFTVRASDNGSPVLFDDETITVTVNNAVPIGIQSGSLVISEIMADPSAVPDTSGEWFEVFNPTTTPLELQGLVIRDDGTNQFTIDQLLLIVPGGRVVFGNNGNLAANGGIPVDFVYTNFTLANSGDVIEIFNGTTSIDRVDYGAAGFPAVQPGHSLSLDPAKLTAVLNDDGANWTVEAIPTPLPVLSIGDATVTEGNSGTVEAVFTVTMSAASSQTVSVPYATADITANAGTDYVATSGVLVFAPGERSKTISVTVNGDTLVEPNESFSIVLSSSVGATVADGQGIGTISNDDAAQSPAVPGLLVITEIMADPTTVPDAAGEWFEIYNPTPVPWDLQGLAVRDDGTNQFAITQPVVIAPGGYLVLGNNGDVNTNGGVQVDFVYTNFTLANFGDVIEIVNGAVTIDRVNYDLVGFPSVIGGQSLSLSSSAMDAFRNDIGSNWSVGAPTPGAVNPGGGSGQPTAVNDTYTVQQNSTLMSGTTLVKDLLVGAGASNPTDLVNVNGTLFFTANDSVGGAELWKSDGTPAGTVMLKDNIGASNLTNVNGTLYFSVNGSQLWKSDGTVLGTEQVKDFVNASFGPQNLADVNGTLFFTADDGVNGRELWKSDGTTAGTVMVKNIRTSALGSDPTHLTNVGGTLFFDAFDATNGRELWKSDGTIAGTVLVKDLTAGSGSTTFNSEYANLNGALFFGTNTGLWRSDGTAAGTVQVKSGVNLQSLITSGGVLYFTSGGLWKSDGTTAGTVQLISTNVENLTDVNGTVYFRTDDGVHGSELWKSNGTVAGTALVKDIAATGSSQPSQLTNVNGTLYFIATDGVNGAELWKSDGTAGGTAMVKDIVPGAGQSVPQLLTNVNGTLFFVADDGVNGRELWASGLAANLLANDSDPDSPPLTANLGTGPTNGTLVLNSDGTFTYRPSAGFTGTDTFTYTVSDGTTTSSAATVTITVTP